MGKMAQLIVTREEADLVTHELTRDVITIGSSPLNHIVIDDPRVSEQHAILARVGDSYWLKDLRSTNGTQVNGVSISDAELNNGDKIQFGTVPSIFATSRKKPLRQMSSSPPDPLTLPALAQTERESPMATAGISPPSSRKSTLIPVAIAVLMIVGGAGWYFAHKREVAPEKFSGSVQAEAQIPIVNPTEAEVASKRPGPMEEFPVSNSPTIARPSIVPANRLWLFPDSSSRYLSATDLSSLSSADLWRARNEIFARKGYKFSTPRGIAFAQTLGNHYRGVDDDEGRVFNHMNQYERANVTFIRAIEKGR
jgi:FHA domain/YARHG domain